MPIPSKHGVVGREFPAGRRLEWTGRRLHLGGQPVRLLSGAIHYFRTLPQDWTDRLEKLRDLGANTVETYVAWNLHEPTKGEYRFDGLCDLERFINLAGKMGLYVIIRPGPYICAEWDFGGLPWWLLTEGGAQIRCHDPGFLRHVDAWWEVLIPRLAPLLSTHGGPILAMQVENEYGYYGADPAYLRHLRDKLIELGVDVPLFTSDAPTDVAQSLGGVEGAFRTGNFGGDVEERLDLIARRQPDGPLSCMEFWIGWFDAWGNNKHSVRDSADTAANLDLMLSRDATVNFYVFHGGTNFGFTNGANCSDRFEPHVTSYDYDALLSECGDVTSKYIACRKVARKHGFDAGQRTFAPSPKLPERSVAFDGSCSLDAALSIPGICRPTVDAPWPLSQEALSLGSGFVHYEAMVHPAQRGERLILRGVHDFATVLADGQVLGTLYRNDFDAGTAAELRLPEGSSPLRLQVLVENMGRPNFGHRMTEPKGLTGGAFTGDRRHDERAILHWRHTAMPLADITAVTFDTMSEQGGPAFYRARLELAEDEIGDSFLAVPAAIKCVVFVNGFNIGRLWRVGPQRRLYVPRHLLRAGVNEVVVFESVGLVAGATAGIHLGETPDLGD